MDLAAYKTLQQSEWIREQVERISRGEGVPCPVAGCDGTLEAYSVERPPDDPRVGLPGPGGVRCVKCKATSRPVAL